MAGNPERDFKASEENRRFRANFHDFLDRVFIRDEVTLTTDVRQLIGRMMDNLSTHTLECIRQSMEEGKVEASTLPQFAIDGWKRDLQKISEAAHTGEDSPGRTLERIDRMIYGG